ncbi:MAG: N-acetylmuramoyl-L-alanine amidase [Elusimicrobia bacterium]|nr:N-acetylmuramoyl-L-alanine amidase [Elusimicrobiota bacterium]
MLSPLLLAWAASARAAPVISVSHPTENLSVGQATATFIYGNVQPPDARLKINGTEVKLYKTGGFLAFLPVQPGTFTFHCEAALSTETAVLDRHVRVTAPLPPSPSDRKFLDEDATVPPADLELRPGDWVRVQLKATAGMKGTYDIAGVRNGLPLVEGSTAGLYLGAYQLQPEDKANGAEIRFTLKGAPGRIKTTAKGRLSVLHGGPKVATAWPLKADSVVVRTAPESGYMLFLATGTRVVVDGRVGGEARLRLADGETGWAEASALKFLPPGTPPPQTELGTIHTQAAVDGAQVKLSLSEKIPYTFEQPQPDLLKVRLYYTFAHVEWIVYDPRDQFVKEVRWRQPSTGVAEVEIHLAGPLWGFDGTQESGGLRVDLRRPPAFAAAPESPLKDRLIVLDPGHSPSDPGRVTPTGHTEREINLLEAMALKPLLEKEGAKVLLTRDTNDAEVPLHERRRLAVANRADAYISLHNNALPNNVDPFEAPRGYSVFYYHPASLAFARHLHVAYQKDFPDLADEGFRYGNLNVARMSLMPSTLVESAYFIFPEQEEMLLSESFNKKLAQTLLEGLRSFFAAEREAQKRAAP